jgi:hypothetical protein
MRIQSKLEELDGFPTQIPEQQQEEEQYDTQYNQSQTSQAQPF